MVVKVRLTALAAVCLSSFPAPATVFEASGTGASAPRDYVPAQISNGELSLCVDYTGTMEPAPSRNWHPDPSVAQVWLQGRRKSPPQADFFAFGAFTALLSVDGKGCPEPDRWRQALDTHRAVVTCETEWADGALKIVSELFVPKGTNVVAVRRTFSAARTAHVSYAETYRIPDDERVVLDAPEGGLVSGRMFGKKVFAFAVASDASEGTVAREPGCVWRTFDLTLKAGESKTVDLAYAFADTRFGGAECPEPRTAAAALARYAVAEWTGLRERHLADWRAFWEVSEIVTPEPALNRLADASLYALRCNVSRWGFPVAVKRESWSGRYFGFDEMFQSQAMSATGHFAESGACTAWRRSVLLQAERRIGHYWKPGRWGGWLFWEMDEDGDCENCPPGFWEKHIFNHSTLARTMWEHYNYTGDADYLRKTGYPVMLAMARYLRNNWVYDAPEGVKYIGKCTDLERLGPARDRPFCTTCGAIDTLRLTARAAAALGVADGETEDFVRTADALLKSLPSKDGAYTVDVAAEQASVALLSGLFPFPVDDLDPAKQRKAVDVILADVTKYGNMYPSGQKVCPWYAGFISAALSRLGDREKAVAVLRDAADMLGPMGTVWEINEEKLRSRPGFTTAAGNCLYALTRLFLTEKDGEVEIARGVPSSWRDYAFRLPVPGGAWLAVAVVGGRLVRFEVDNPQRRPLPRFRMPPEFGDVKEIGKHEEQ